MPLSAHVWDVGSIFAETHFPLPWGEDEGGHGSLPEDLGIKALV